MLPKILTIIALLIIAYGFIRWELYKSKQRTIPHSIEPVKLRRSRKKKIEIDTQQQPEIVRMTREFDKKRKRKAAMSRSGK